MKYAKDLLKVVAEIDAINVDNYPDTWAPQTARDLAEKAAELTTRLVTQDDIIDVLDAMMENESDHCCMNDAGLMDDLAKVRESLRNARLRRAAIPREGDSFLKRLGRQKACEMLQA